MVDAVKDSAKANAEFTKSILIQTAEIIEDNRQGRIPVMDALLQARDRFLERETQQNKKARTYHFSNLMKDLRRYVIEHENGDSDSFTPVNQWAETLNPHDISEKLTTAAEAIVKTVEERTARNGWLGTLDDKQLAEHVLMQKAVEFLLKQGIEIEIIWRREDPNSSIDYHGEIKGELWDFELKQLREDPKGYHRKVGHPNERKSIQEQLDRLGNQIPRIPCGPNALRRNLNQLVEKASQKKIRNGAKYCLVIHNQQFLHIPDWEKIAWPDLSKFDAVMVLHDETIPPAWVWQIIQPDAFGKTTQSGTLEDLEKMVLAQQGQGPDPALVKGAWLRLDEQGITEQDVIEALNEVRNNG